MRVLIIKMSSMGDVLHTLPALTDVATHFPDVRFDWLVEEDFAEIPAWHSHVENVFPIALRRWRKNIWQSLRSGECQAVIRKLRAHRYDYIIDAQGLTKSAIFARIAKGKRYGLSSKSARDPIAFLHYHKNYKVSWELHAVERIRKLFANVLGYEIPQSLPDYGIDLQNLSASPFSGKYLVFLHGTTWATKLWPESYWRKLVEVAVAAGYEVYLNSGNPDELARAQRVTLGITGATAMPRHNMATLAAILAYAEGVVAVDTGLGHLTAALAKPAVSIYGATNAKMTGAHGMNQTHLQAEFACSPCLSKSCDKPAINNIHPPCYAQLNPKHVWQKLLQQMDVMKVSACV